MRRRRTIWAEVSADGYVPYVQHVSAGVVLLDDRSRLAMFRVAGKAWETADDDEVMAWRNQLNVLAQNVASDRLVFSVHVVRTAADPGDYPRGRFRSGFARRLDDAYRETVTRQLYRNQMFIAVLRRSTPLLQVGEMLAVARRQAEESAADMLSHLEETCRVLRADLDSYGMVRLGLRQEGRVTFSEVAEALALILTGTVRRIPLVTGRLGRAIHQDRVIVGKETVEIREDEGSRFLAGLALKEYPATSWPGVFSTLLCAPYFFSLTQSFACLGKAASLDVLTRKQNQLVSASDKAANQVASLGDAADELTNNEFVMGSHHLVLSVFADDLVTLARVVAQARSDLADSGAVVVREDLGAEAAFWSHLPGNAWCRTRPGVVTSRNWAGMAPLHGYPEGSRRGHWGEPLMLFRTTGGTPYLFHLHVEDVGNVVMFGPTGSGKTTLLLALLTQAEKLGVTVVFFDKDRGGEILARAVGGTYLVLPSGEPTGMAPLRALSASPADTDFLIGWVRALIASEGYVPTPEDNRRIAQGVTALLGLPPEHRSLAELRAFLGQRDQAGAGAHLDRWCAGGALGWAFDGEHDQVDLTAPFIGFDMTRLLDDDDVRGPAMAYLFHRIEALLDGRRLILAVDEFWKALADPEFRDMVNNTLKTVRKLNGALILATQSPSEALASPIAHSIVEQCPTQILMPAPKANTVDYCEGLKLTEPEFRMVSQDLAVGGRRFLLKQGQVSVACDLDLSGAPDIIAVLSGRKNTVRIMEEVRQSTGDDPSLWLDEFLMRAREEVA
jgi:type IV secretion system protein VirB4